MEFDIDDSLQIEINNLRLKAGTFRDDNICPLLIQNSMAQDPVVIDIDELGDLVLVVGTNECEVIDGHHNHEEAICFRVCSRTLARWSPVMKTMLFGKFRESTQDVVELPDDNPEIMKALLDIAHGDFKAVLELDKRHADTSSRHFLADDVYSVIALANKYIMTRALCPWASRMIPTLMPKEEQSEDYCSIADFRRLEKALFIACEFGHFELFEGASTRLVWLLKRDQELFSSCIEPFPSCMDSSSSSDKNNGTIGHIRHLRLQLIESILSPLRGLISALKDGNDPTGLYHCDAESKNNYSGAMPYEHLGSLVALSGTRVFVPSARC
ncbi:hypothetical protein E8E14_013717 [Neopestalotiopsis sp. 37M]|nr:hypothetical protein E8E14_013717 [Neopestalotiopsis sp. 37M]